MEAEICCLPEVKIGNHGLRKRVLHKGNSWKTPFPGDEVEVRYTLRLKDGEFFDSSHDKGTPFKFRLGQGEVIRGWDEGIATMKKGERAIFTVPPEMAYGEIGSPPTVPPYATLIFDIEMVSWYSIRDITGDGGILKKIMREGEGWATPKDADEVLVKYVASTEDGIIVSKSDEELEFSLTDGYLCPAMSKAVKTMRKGEKAELSVKFSYCSRYPGDAHCNNDITATNSKLTIDLELLSWKNVIDVMGDKKILKKVIKMGDGFDRPSEGSLAKVIYIGRKDDGTIFECKGTPEEPFEYICLEEQINEGLDRAVMTMRKGEQATVKVSSEFLHGTENGKWPPTASVLYEIMLINFAKEKSFWKMDTQEKLEACQSKKSDGNALFKAGRFELASKKYEKASKYIEFDHSFNDDEKSLASSLLSSCSLNNAACKLKLGKYFEASRLCTKVLEVDPCCVKALFRRSQSYLRTSDLEKAEADIKRALAIDPNNREVRLVYQELKDKKRQYFRQEAEIFTNMLSSMG
ncbi:70 kDa peptidyl-prolyl isomerase-like isoform X1 [Coffea eugenioides]|uniref:70 kDa peptidyl-prolyl isomerase-like isoform X1 n=1 Tax=Coffea eugenioides TaxID=49369 RepID=UPI000F61217A|nr:70 kDa peptidyl-prolyl isomerase-like isoform X1 [Coffea eugenioides]